VHPREWRALSENWFLNSEFQEKLKQIAWQGAEILVVTEGGILIITGLQIFGVELLRLHE
jgi:hypothetical protein